MAIGVRMARILTQNEGEKAATTPVAIIERLIGIARATIVERDRAGRMYVR